MDADRAWRYIPLGRDCRARNPGPAGLALIGALSLLVAWPAAQSQSRLVRDTLVAEARIAAQGLRLPTRTEAGLYFFRSARDSIEWESARMLAAAATGLRVVVSLLDRELRVISGESDTLLRAPIAVASGLTLEYAGRSWTFRTPRGRHDVQRKVVDPQWTPPDWAYAEAALEHSLALRSMRAGGTRLSDGKVLSVRDSVVGLLDPGSNSFAVLPVDEHIVFDSALWIPPIGTHNRRLAGELGRYALDLGDGYLLHGTNQPFSIGAAVTHGCIRLRDEDLEWLFEQVPVGTAVYIF
ncbi:MAG: L,D-transpeptidase [Gemmatimonadota bacterium]